MTTVRDWSCVLVDVVRVQVRALTCVGRRVCRSEYDFSVCE